MQLDAIKKLCIMQIRNGGLGREEYGALAPSSREFLEEGKEGRFFLKVEIRKMITVAMTGGVFDIIHPGHVMTLEQAKEHGDILVVAIAADETVRRVKKREPMHMQEERVRMVDALKPVDLAIAGGSDWSATLRRVSPDIVIFGYDQQEKKIDGIRTIKLGSFSSHENSKTGKVREKLGI